MPITASIQQSFNEMQFFALQGALGTLITEAGLVTAVGTICSYTPASGKTFTLREAQLRTNNIDATIQLRNNGSATETRKFATTSASVVLYFGFVTKGDQMAGNGSNTYDIYNSANGGSILLNGAFNGYIH